jgi:hypothetical protein
MEGVPVGSVGMQLGPTEGDDDERARVPSLGTSEEVDGIVDEGSLVGEELEFVEGVVLTCSIDGADDGSSQARPSHSIRTSLDPESPDPSLVTIRRPQLSKSTSTGRNPSSHFASGG